MSADRVERVDKNWQQRELDQYSTEAILGTLSHYGVHTSEAEIKELALREYPISIAHIWSASWKGKGQFSKFPVAAAEEMWHRLLPGEIAPADVALALIKLLVSLDQVLADGKDDGTGETRFKVLENYLPKLPAGKSERREAFEVEVMYALGDQWSEVLDNMGVDLATKGKRAEAERLTSIEEALFPVRAGTARALMRAALGETVEAKAGLDALVENPGSDDDVKVAAIDAYLDLKHVPEAKRALLEQIAKAGAARDIERISAVLVDRVTRVGQALPKEESRELVKALEATLIAISKSEPE